MVRILAIMVAAAFLSASAGVPVMASDRAAVKRAPLTDISAAKKPVKKKKKKVKVEYMRAVPVK